jgi:tRNA (guanine-N7-)-methyltransferase
MAGKIIYLALRASSFIPSAFSHSSFWFRHSPMPALFVPPDHFRELQHAEMFPDPSRPLEIDLGCGDGTFLLGMAAQHPERDFLGVERMLGRVSKTARKIEARHLSNARIMRLESAYTVAWLLPRASVSRLHLLCPDPWPKKKHAARRLVNQAEFLDGLARILRPGGEFLLKTDDQPYFEDALLSLESRSDQFERLDWPEDAFFYPITDFEQSWLDIGRSIQRARWRLRAGGE